MAVQELKIHGLIYNRRTDIIGFINGIPLVFIELKKPTVDIYNAYIDNLRKQGQPVTQISSGSSLKICLVAEGTADIYPRFAPTMEWDTAAGHAIARAAGCNVYFIDEKTPLVYNKPDLHNPWFVVK